MKLPNVSYLPVIPATPMHAVRANSRSVQLPDPSVKGRLMSLAFVRSSRFTFGLLGCSGSIPGPFKFGQLQFLAPACLSAGECELNCAEGRGFFTGPPNVGGLIIRIGFWGIFYYKHNKEPPN